MTRYEEKVVVGRRSAVPGLDLSGRPLHSSMIPSDDHDRFEFAIGDLVEILVAVLRRHPHIGNVINHICGGRWGDVDQVLRVILDPRTTCNDMSPLAENVLELLWAERGTTGRILKPYFRSLLNKLLPADPASRLCAHVSSLSLEMEALRYAPRGQRQNDGVGQGAATISGGGDA